MATISRIGWGQVEPNHLSAQRTGQIYAQLPCNSEIKVLENGQFAKYDYAAGEVNFTGEGEFMLVLNEVKTYDVRQSYKDFALVKEDYDHGILTPRLFKTNVGDIFTTNCLEGHNTGAKAKFEGTQDITVGTKLKINSEGFLSTTGGDLMEFKVVKIYTMPDGQQGVKVQRVK